MSMFEQEDLKKTIMGEQVLFRPLPFDDAFVFIDAIKNESKAERQEALKELIVKCSYDSDGKRIWKSKAEFKNVKPAAILSLMDAVLEANGLYDIMSGGKTSEKKTKLPGRPKKIVEETPEKKL